MREKGVKEFAKTASSTYKTISASEKEELRKNCSDEKPVMVKDIKHEGHKIFKNMDKQVEPNLAFYVSLLYGSLGSLATKRSDIDLIAITSHEIDEDRAPAQLFEGNCST